MSAQPLSASRWGEKKKKRGAQWFLTFNPLFSSLQTKADHADNAEVELTRCSRGHYFGELALVTNKPRAASAYAVGNVKCVGKKKYTPTHSFNTFVSINAAHKENDNEVRCVYKVALFPPISGNVIAASKALM